jgi:hypothetical protein
MIHYVYATRGGYLYMVGKYGSKPNASNPGEFVVSVPDKTSQVSIDGQAHKRFIEHLRRPRKVAVAHDRHRAASHEKELIAV